MKNVIKILIVSSIVIIGIYVWYVPHMSDVRRGAAEPYAYTQEENGLTEEFAEAEAENLPETEDLYEAKTSPETEQSPEMTEELKYDIASGYLILVNKSHGIAEDYKPDDLSAILYYDDARSAEGRFMRAEAANAFHRLVEEAARQDISLVMTTAYRSYGFQSVLYNNYVAKDGQAAADRYSAAPGKSEHQTGLAVDVSAPSVDFRLDERFAETKEGKWLADNAQLFGFIIRFPYGKEEITGYQYEPWHIRYVGLAAAEYIFKNKITLEEYVPLLDRESEEL